MNAAGRVRNGLTTEPTVQACLRRRANAEKRAVPSARRLSGIGNRSRAHPAGRGRPGYGRGDALQLRRCLRRAVLARMGQQPGAGARAHAEERARRLCPRRRSARRRQPRRSDPASPRAAAARSSCSRRIPTPSPMLSAVAAAPPTTIPLDDLTPASARALHSPRAVPPAGQSCAPRRRSRRSPPRRPGSTCFARPITASSRTPATISARR